MILKLHSYKILFKEKVISNYDLNVKYSLRSNKATNGVEL